MVKYGMKEGDRGGEEAKETRWGSNCEERECEEDGGGVRVSWDVVGCGTVEKRGLTG